MNNRHRLLSLAGCLGFTALVVSQSNFLGKANADSGFQNEVSIKVVGDQRLISSNGIPDHKIGQFPNRGNPNKVSPQKYSWSIPLKPSLVTRQSRGGLFGVAVNGVPFDPGTAELWNNNFAWHYEALSGQIANGRGLGVDENLAHVQPNGAYHYHGLPMGLLNKLDYTHKMALVGWAADGYPVYGNFGYSDAGKVSSMKKLASGYRLRSGTRPDGPGGVYDGSFASDYEWIAGLGDLDQFNGRQGVTPEFPSGTYYYVLTENFPFIPRQLKGQADPSFSKRDGGPPPGQGGQRRGPSQGGPGQAGLGQGGPGQGGPAQGGPGQGGFGGPPPGMVPADVLANYLELSPTQKVKLATFKKALAAIVSEGAMPHVLTEMKLTNSQIERLGSGEKPAKVLTELQKELLNSGPPGL